MPDINNYINKLVEKINDKRYYYSQNRENQFATDCSWLVITTLKDCGFPVGGATYTGNMLEAFKSTGAYSIIKFSQGSMQKGDILFKHISGSNGHVVTYLGDGMIGEACNKKYGLRVTKYYANSYQYIIRYTGEGSTVLPNLPTIRKGDKNIYVGFLQLFLNKHLGTKLVIDCDFGSKTAEAVMNFQIKYQSSVGEVDKIVGRKTWAKIYSIMVQS